MPSLATCNTLTLTCVTAALVELKKLDCQRAPAARCLRGSASSPHASGKVSRDRSASPSFTFTREISSPASAPEVSPPPPLRRLSRGSRHHSSDIRASELGLRHSLPSPERFASRPRGKAPRCRSHSPSPRRRRRFSSYPRRDCSSPGAAWHTTRDLPTHGSLSPKPRGRASDSLPSPRHLTTRFDHPCPQ